ncbi:hypothetical protein [Streptococcus plurextorum]|nr:hypothetical protein [Streptococcus plurextorum]
MMKQEFQTENKLIDPDTYKPDINEKATLYDYKSGKKGNYVNGKWTCN